MRQRDDGYTVTIGQSDVSLRKRGQSNVRCARILGDEMHDGIRTLYLDRLLLPAGNVNLGEGWSASGCVSTILTQR